MHSEHTYTYANSNNSYMRYLKVSLFVQVKAKPNCKYVELDDLLAHSDVISLHAPLTKETFHIINKQTINKMKNVRRPFSETIA